MHINKENQSPFLLSLECDLNCFLSLKGDFELVCTVLSCDRSLDFDLFWSCPCLVLDWVLLLFSPLSREWLRRWSRGLNLLPLEWERYRFLSLECERLFFLSCLLLERERLLFLSLERELFLLLSLERERFFSLSRECELLFLPLYLILSLDCDLLCSLDLSFE